MICPKCKAEMPDQATYCIQCGRKLPQPDGLGPGAGPATSGPVPADVPAAGAERAEPSDPAEPRSGMRGGRLGRGPAAKSGATGPADEQGVVIGGFRFTDDAAGAAAGATGNRPTGGARRDGRSPGGPDERWEGWMSLAVFASPAQRFGAFLLDFLILGAGVFFATYVLALVAPGLFESPDSEVVVGNVVPLLISWLYYAGMESSRLQATPGKMALGFKVTDLRGGRIGFGRASVRHFAKILSGALLLLGYLLILVSPKRQGLHDMIAGCVALRRQEGESLSAPLRP